MFVGDAGGIGVGLGATDGLGDGVGLGTTDGLGDGDVASLEGPVDAGPMLDGDGWTGWPEAPPAGAEAERSAESATRSMSAADAV